VGLAGVGFEGKHQSVSLEAATADCADARRIEVAAAGGHVNIGIMAGHWLHEDIVFARLGGDKHPHLFLGILAPYERRVRTVQVARRIVAAGIACVASAVKRQSAHFERIPARIPLLAEFQVGAGLADVAAAVAELLALFIAAAPILTCGRLPAPPCATGSRSLKRLALSLEALPGFLPRLAISIVIQLEALSRRRVARIGQARQVAGYFGCAHALALAAMAINESTAIPVIARRAPGDRSVAANARRQIATTRGTRISVLASRPALPFASIRPTFLALAFRDTAVGINEHALFLSRRGREGGMAGNEHKCNEGQAHPTDKNAAPPRCRTPHDHLLFFTRSQDCTYCPSALH